MAWASALSGTQFIPDGTYETVQRSAADWQISLNPGETAVVQLEYTRDTSTPTEDLQTIIVTSPDDGTTYDTDEQPYAMVWQDEDDGAVGRKTILVTGCEQFKIRSRLRDTDDTAGGDDTTGVTLDTIVRLNGISQ